MPQYAIQRFAKHKGDPARPLEAHHERQKKKYASNPDIDTAMSKHNMFSGLVECTDCGAKLYYCTTNYFEERQDHFVCSNYKSNTGTCSAHFIRAVVLEKLVLEHQQKTVQYVREYENEFVQSMGKSLRQTAARKSPQSAGDCRRPSGA